MAEIIPVEFIKPNMYTVDVTVRNQDIEFVVNGVRTDVSSKLKIAEELERIVRIIRSDVLVN